MINRTLIESRLSLIVEMVEHLDALAATPEPLFLANPRDVAAGESFLRRSLEAVFDVGRHLLAKSGHSNLAKEDKSIAQGLGSMNVVPQDFVPTLIRMAGYRNRMVHFYHEIAPTELRHLIVARRDDLLRFVDFVKRHLKLSFQRPPEHL